MLISKKIEMKWNSRNKKRYEELGYVFTKVGDTFIIDVEHLSKYSKYKVQYECDYCGTIHTKDWSEYNRQRKIVKKDCCSNQECKNAKLQDSMLIKYGETNISKTEYFKEAYKNKMQENYGVDNYLDLLNKERRKNAKGKVIETDEDRILQRKFPKYREWRKSVFERDNYTCQLCGDKTGGNLNAHHKDGYEWCVKRRTDVSNGVTLCKDCHDCFHIIFGYGANTERQFHEYAIMYFTIELNKYKFENKKV